MGVLLHRFVALRPERRLRSSRRFFTRPLRNVKRSLRRCEAHAPNGGAVPDQGERLRELRFPPLTGHVGYAARSPWLVWC